MIKGFYNAFQEKELRKRIFYTLGVLILFRLGAHITLPGINPAELDRFFLDLQKTGANNSFFDFINMFTGGALKQFAIFGLGVMPYISASIIMQLLQVAVPFLERLAKEEGAYGRAKINRYTRFLTIFICIVEGFGIYSYFKNQVLIPATGRGYEILISGSTVNFSFVFMFILVITAGTMFLLWLGEQITERGIGNGVSMIIFAGIVSRLPSVLYQSFATLGKEDTLGLMKLIFLLLVFLIFIAIVIVIREGERRVPVRYAKRVVGNKMYQGQNTYIPFKVDPAGVIAIIFASSIILFPSQLLGVFGGRNHLVSQIIAVLSPGHPVYYVLYFFLVMFFCYFYTAIMYNPLEMSSQIQKNGGFIPGIRPGTQTTTYLEKLLRRLVFPGSLIIGFIALAPSILSDILGISYQLARAFGGTTLMIMVGVALDTLKQIESKLKTKNLEGFSKGKKSRYRS